jgi:NitT/TauT family transport system substrate-binding protein
MNLRPSRLLLVCLLIAVLLGACSGGSTASKPPLRFEYTQWWPDYTLLVAKEKGFFDKYGVNVEPVLYAGAEGYPQIFKDLPAKKVDGGLLAIGDALVTSQSVDLKVVSVYDDGGTNTVVALPEISAIADLKGKRIGVPVGTSYELFVRHMLASASLKPADVTLVNLDPTEVAAHLTSKDIAAGYVWSVDMAPGNRVIFQKTDAQGLFPDVIIFRAEVVKSRPEDIRAFLKAWFEAVEWRKANPAETLEIVSKYTKTPVAQITPDNEIKILNQSDNVTIFQPTISGGSFSLPQAAQLNADFQKEAGFMPKPVDLSVFLDGSFLK